MNSKNTLKIIAVCAVSTWSSALFAHDGQALAGAHWHATDGWGFVAMAGVLALGLWLSRGDN